MPALILDEGRKYFNITRITRYSIDATDAVKKGLFLSIFLSHMYVIKLISEIFIHEHSFKVYLKIYM